MSRRTFKLPEPKDIHRDDVQAFCELLGHDPKHVLRIRVQPKVVEVDVLPPRSDIAKLTVTHQVISPDQGGEE